MLFEWGINNTNSEITAQMANLVVSLYCGSESLLIPA
jgi:hypothetical protein